MNINVKSYNLELAEDIVLQNAINIVRKQIINVLDNLDSIGKYYIKDNDIVEVKLNDGKRIEIAFVIVYGKPTYINVMFTINNFKSKIITILDISNLNNILDSDERTFKRIVESYFDIITKN